jgi:hypothetical protein
VIQGFLPVEFGVHRHADFKGQSMRGCESVPKDDSGDETAFDAFSIFNGDIAPIYNGLLVHISP